MSFKGVFVDDQELAVYAEVLSSAGRLDFQPEEVEEVVLLSRKIIAAQPLIVALDYRLDEAPAKITADQTYKGSALAQHLRDASIEHPGHDFAMVLVSAEGKIKKLFRPDKTAHDLFDRIYVKEEIVANRENCRHQLVSLCAGYEHLRAAHGKYDIVDLMAGNENDRPHVDVQELRVKLDAAAAPHIASRIIFGLIDRPGPLVDTADACAYFGIALGNGDAISAELRKVGAAYDGIFADGWPRWWANRLETWAHGIFKRRPTGLPASDRATALSEATGVHFEAANSPWNQSAHELIAFACACCRRGTELRHSVAAFDAGLPRYATRRRICWDCIQTDQCEAMEPPLEVEDTDRDIAEQVKTRSRNGPSVGGAQA